jgi:hypothetical protein
MSNLQFDFDIILDVLAKREPFFGSSSRVWSKVERGEIQGYIASHSVTALFYLIAKASRNKDFARECVSDLLSVFKIATVSEATLRLALNTTIPDFEDAVQFAAAKEVKAEFIVTRNTGDYKGLKIPALTPDLFLATLNFVE